MLILIHDTPTWCYLGEGVQFFRPTLYIQKRMHESAKMSEQPVASWRRRNRLARRKNQCRDSMFSCHQEVASPRVASRRVAYIDCYCCCRRCGHLATTQAAPSTVPITGRRLSRGYVALPSTNQGNLITTRVAAGTASTAVPFSDVYCLFRVSETGWQGNLVVAGATYTVTLTTAKLSHPDDQYMYR